MKRVAVIGGGMAGVTAAYELARRASSGAAVEATLYEASARLGGIVETSRQQDFIIECGPDAWVTEKPWAQALAEELGLADQIIPSNDETRKTYVLLDGHLVPMPDGMRMMVPTNLDALDKSHLFSPEAPDAYRNEITRADQLKAEAPDHDESVASFVLRHFGAEVLEKIGAPLLGGVFGGNVHTLSVHAVMAPFVTMEREYGSLILALQARSAARKDKPASVFTSLRSGIGTLIESMQAQIPSAWIRRNTPVTSLTQATHGWTINTTTSAEHFDAIFVATPVDVTQRLMQPIDATLASLLDMEASSALVVGFAFPESFTLPAGFGFLVPSSSASSLLAGTFVDQKFSHRAPEGTRLLRAFFGGNAADRLSPQTDAEIAAIARRELESILGPLPQPSITIVRRWPRALPQYAVGHLERMAKLDAHIRAFRDIWLLGNGYRGVGLPDLVRDAQAAVTEFLGTPR